MSRAKKEKVADLQKILQESSSTSSSSSSSDLSDIRGFNKRGLKAIETIIEDICRDKALFLTLYNTYKSIKKKDKLDKVCKKIVERKPSTLLRNIQSNKDIEELIVKTYQDSLVYKLAEGIPVKILLYKEICGNPNAIDLLKERVAEEYNKLSNKVDWEYLSMNPNAIELLRANPSKIDWRALSKNPKAIELLKERVEYENGLGLEEYNKLLNRINWLSLSKNPNAIELLKANPAKIHWGSLSENSEAADLLEANPDKIYWGFLSANAGAFKIIIDEYKGNPKSARINWNGLSSNTDTKAFGLFEDNFDKIHWGNLCQNTNKKAIQLLKLIYKINSGNYTPLIYKTRRSFLSKVIRFLEEKRMNEPTWLDWKHLSANPEAMDILNAEYERNNENNEIVLSALCKNPNAMKIILNEIKAGRIYNEWQLRELATNPSIFTI